MATPARTLASTAMLLDPYRAAGCCLCLQVGQAERCYPAIWVPPAGPSIAALRTTLHPSCGMQVLCPLLQACGMQYHARAKVLKACGMSILRESSHSASCQGVITLLRLIARDSRLLLLLMNQQYHSSQDIGTITHVTPHGKTGPIHVAKKTAAQSNLTTTYYLQVPCIWAKTVHNCSIEVLVCCIIQASAWIPLVGFD
jgi:hypothetical protein